MKKLQILLLAAVLLQLKPAAYYLIAVCGKMNSQGTFENIRGGGPGVEYQILP